MMDGPELLSLTIGMDIPQPILGASEAAAARQHEGLL